jgi:glycosyltransferase involved in cell wall biosynthesis
MECGAGVRLTRWSACAELPHCLGLIVESDTTKPLISAIIPTYNHGEYVGRAVESILAQEGRGRHFDVEVCVVDDASTDATPEIVLQYPEVRYLRQFNRQGVSAAMNAGIRASTGEYISILGADDTWLPHKLRVQVPLIIAHPEVGVLYSQAIRRVAGKEDELFPDALRAPSGWVFEEMLTHSFAGHFAGLLVRREAFDKAGYFDESLVTYEDYDMSLRLAFHFQFLFEPGPVTIYNLSPHGLWLTRAAKGDASKDYGRVIHKALKMIPDSDRRNRMLEEAPIRIALQAISPFLLADELTQAWSKLLDVLRMDPSCGRYRWVRDSVRWVTRKRLLKAASPLAEARDLCGQIRKVMYGVASDRRFMRAILSEVWADVLLSDAIRRVSSQGAVYAAIRAVSYAPSDVALARRLGRRLLKRKWSRRLFEYPRR